MDDDDMTPTKRKRYMRRTLPTSSGGLDYPLLTFLCGVGIIIGAFVLRKYAMEAVTYKTASGAVVSRYQWKRQKKPKASWSTPFAEEWFPKISEKSSSSTVAQSGDERTVVHSPLAKTPSPAAAKKPAPVLKRRKRAKISEPTWYGRWEGSLASAFTSCRKLVTASSMAAWQQPCASRPWAHHFRYGPLDCTFLGTDYGGFYLPNRMCFLRELPEPPNRSHVAYGFGVGSDVSYDIALAAAFPHMKVRLFDPTPWAVQHANQVLAALDRGKAPCPWTGPYAPSEAACTGKYFESISKSRVPTKQLSVHPWAIGTTEGELVFQHTATGSLYTSNTSIGGASEKRELRLPVKTLPAIMAALGDEVVDVLKLDIEGAEVEVIPGLLDLWSTWPQARWPKVLLIDMDSVRRGHPRWNVTGANMAIERLISAGYVLFAHPKRPDYTFVLPLTQRNLYYGAVSRPPPPPKLEGA